MAADAIGFVSSIASGGVAHLVDTDVNYTSGQLWEWKNNGVAKASVEWDGRIVATVFDGPIGSGTATPAAAEVTTLTASGIVKTTAAGAALQADHGADAQVYAEIKNTEGIVELGVFAGGVGYVGTSTPDDFEIYSHDGLAVTFDSGQDATFAADVAAGTFTGALTGNVTGNVSGSAGSSPAGSLTGNTLAAGVTGSSLTSLGTIGSLVATTVDINGGTIDGTNIGVSAQGSLSATTGAFSGNVAVLNGAGVIVGNATQVAGANATADAGQLTTQEFQILGTAGSSAQGLVGRFSANSSGSGFTFLKSRAAAIGDFAIVEDGDFLGQIAFAADDGTNYGTISARITARVDDASPVANSIGGQLIFEVARGLATNDITEAMRINADLSAVFTGSVTGAAASFTSGAFSGDVTIGDNAGLAIGAAQQTIGGSVAELQVLGSGSPDSSFSIGRWSANASAPAIRMLKARGFIGGFDTVVSGDALGIIQALGADGTDGDTIAAAIVFLSEGTIGTGQVPGVIKLQTAASGTLADALTIDSSQNTTLAGILTVSDETDTSGVGTGALRVAGGADFAKGLWVGATSVLVGVVTIGASIVADAGDGAHTWSGGTGTSSGGNINLFGQAHSSQANDLQFRSGSNVKMLWDDSDGRWEMTGGLTVSGLTEVQALTINGTLKAPFANTVSGTGLMVTTNDGSVQEIMRDSSTARHKTDIMDAKIDPAKVLGIMAKEYGRESQEGQRFTGFIVEDFDKAGFKNIIDYDKDGLPTGFLEFGRGITALHHTVLQDHDTRLQEAQHRIEVLENLNVVTRFETSEEKIARLTNRVAELEMAA